MDDRRTLWHVAEDLVYCTGVGAAPLRAHGDTCCLPVEVMWMDARPPSRADFDAAPGATVTMLDPPTATFAEPAEEEILGGWLEQPSGAKAGATMADPPPPPLVTTVRAEPLADPTFEALLERLLGTKWWWFVQ
mmetsp:Transcript_35614/g.83283  ORF Transcript_35614/g.83283 Transcript_35614/m.83283 type:complete len:134 (+) Transcript_35614:256-657(+)